jgi:hypothetical protein
MQQEAITTSHQHDMAETSTATASKPTENKMWGEDVELLVQGRITEF